ACRRMFDLFGSRKKEKPSNLAVDQISTLMKIANNHLVRAKIVVFLLLVMLGLATSGRGEAIADLIGVWREDDSTNTISFTTNRVRLAPILEMDYTIQGNTIVCRKPANIQIDRFEMEIRTNATIMKKFQSHPEGPFSDLVVPFTLTHQDLRLNWGSGWEHFTRVENQRIPPLSSIHPLRVIAIVQTNETRLNEQFPVALRVENKSAADQTIRVMNCSWQEHWQCSNPAISLLGWDCGKNFAADVTLKPKEAYTNVLNMVVIDSTAKKTLSFRMGFTPIGVTNTLWSDAVTIEVKR
ncbi:MAG: hypothetical protein JWM68_4152, partial [Verrucomicrobiales bacterium]|nr:hypothetical protein [Verrucomicrobiales bacterium]